MSKLLTSEACIYLGGISRKTYQGYIKTGKIKGEMENGRWMVEKAELNRFLQAQAGLLSTSTSETDRAGIVAEIMAIEHIKPEHRSLVEDYASECVNLNAVKSSRERSECLARKLRIAEALLITPRSLSRIKELSQELETASALNKIFILALESDPEIAPLYRRKAGDIVSAMLTLGKDFTDSGLKYDAWLTDRQKTAA